MRQSCSFTCITQQAGCTLWPVADISMLQGPEKRAEYGIKDNLIRFSCGLEGVEDIWRDINQALEAVG